MTLYSAAIGLVIVGLILALIGVVLLATRPSLHLRVRAGQLILLGAALALASGPTQRAAQRQMRAALNDVPAVTFRLETPTDTFTTTLTGADAACLATHVQTRRISLVTPSGTRILPSRITSLTATPARALPPVTVNDCRFDPTPILFTANLG